MAETPKVSAKYALAWGAEVICGKQEKGKSPKNNQ